MMTRKHFEEVAEVIKENTMNDTQPIINKKTFAKRIYYDSFFLHLSIFLLQYFT